MLRPPQSRRRRRSPELVHWRCTVRRLVTLVLFAPWVALFTGCRDRAEPTGIAPSAEALATKDPMGSVHRLPASLEQKVQSFRADLEARGYEVARGYWTLWGAEDCKYPIHTLGMCYGNNPTSPYALAVVPTWRQEFRDQSFQHLLTQAQRNMSATFRMSDRDALVVFAQMPPSARYFGIQSNVFTRRAAVNTEDRIYKIVAGLGDSVMRSILFGSSPDPSRMMLVASIGNSINNVVMQGQSGPPWGLERYFVVTPDAGMAGAMTAALVRAGVTSDEVFTEPVAPGLVRTGLRRVTRALQKRKPTTSSRTSAIRCRPTRPRARHGGSSFRSRSSASGRGARPANRSRSRFLPISRDRPTSTRRCWRMIARRSSPP